MPLISDYTPDFVSPLPSGQGIPEELPSYGFGEPDWVRRIARRMEQKYGVPAKLLVAQMKAESGFNPDVIFGKGKWAKGNVAGAAGISQFIVSTARAYGLRVDNEVDERLIPEKAIEAQAKYMADLLKRHGSPERALSSYNSGNPDRYKNPNYKTWYGSVGETHNYVRNILRDVSSPTRKQGDFLPSLVGQVQAAEPLSVQTQRPPMIGPQQPVQNVPKPQPVTNINYLIKKGDTLSEIAQQNRTTVAEIMRANPYIKNKNLIYYGRSLQIPRR